jgi:CRISPR-associated endoribonuclease Cas6
MKNYELKVTLLLKVDIKYEDTHDRLSSNINKAMYEDSKLKELHENKKYKPYCIGSLYPFDMENKIYKANQVYVLTIRSIDKEFINLLKNSLKSSSKLDFNVLAIEFKELKYNFIESAFTLTPTIISITDENKKIRHWTKNEDSLEFVKQRIKDNLEKKYLQIYKEELIAPDDFISMIQIQNKKPIVFNYKKTKLFTNKFKIVFNSDEISQKLAKLAFGMGILEKNSLGFGFLTKGK